MKVKEEKVSRERERERERIRMSSCWITSIGGRKTVYRNYMHVSYHMFQIVFEPMHMCEILLDTSTVILQGRSHTPILSL